MVHRRTKAWLAATVLLGMVGMVGVIFFARAMTAAPTAIGARAAPERLPIGLMNDTSFLPTRRINTSTLGSAEEDGSSRDYHADSSDLVEDHATSSSRADEGSKSSASEFSSSGSDGSRSSDDTDASTSNSETNEDDEEEVEVVFVPANTKTNNTSAVIDENRVKVPRAMASASAFCSAPQPYLANCYKLFADGVERVIQRLAEAVGHLEIEEDHVSCSGVLLNSDSKSTMYFLTASHCLPNEKNVERARIHFTGCAGTNTYTKNKVYAINRRLGYVILRMEVDAHDVQSAYGFLLLSSSRRVYGERVFIAHYSKNKPIKSLTTEFTREPITIQAFVEIPGCTVDSTQSRISYAAPSMDRVAAGAPVISYTSGHVHALHLCGDCSVRADNSALVAHSIYVDLDNKAQLIKSFFADSESGVVVA